MYPLIPDVLYNFWVIGEKDFAIVPIIPNSERSLVKIKKGNKLGNRLVAQTLIPLKQASMHNLGEITSIAIKKNIKIVSKIKYIFFTL